MAEQLHIEFLDRDIVDETAKRMNATVRQISKEEEGISSKFSYRMYPLGLGVPAVKDELFKVQQSIIQDFAKKESCIIVGRCGGYCLRNEERLLKVYIYAPYDAVSYTHLDVYKRQLWHRESRYSVRAGKR